MPSMHEVEKHAFHERLKQQEENAKKIRDGMAAVINEPAQPEPEAPTPEPVITQENEPVAEPVAASQPEPQPAQPAPAADPRENDPNYWKHRHLTTEGILKAERLKAEKMQAEAAALRAEADRLRKEALDRAKAVSAESRERALDQIALTDFFTAQQIEEYGEQHLKTVMQGAVKAAMKLNRAELDAELERVRGEVDSIRNVAAQSREDAFWNTLSTEVPDYSAINASPEFQAWVAEIDPVSGRTRDSYIKEAQAALDARRVVAIFKSFQPTPPPVAQPAPQRPSAPPVGKAAEATLPPPPQKLRMADWKAFQLEVTQGKWRGREAEAAARDRQFIAAMQAGNLV